MSDSGSVHLDLQTELIQDVIQNLLSKNVIGEKALGHLKHEETKTVEPAIIMDLRHQQIRQEHEQNQRKNQIFQEARRLIHNEERAEKERISELRMVEREIKKFQDQLATEHRKLTNNYNLQISTKKLKKLWTVNRDSSQVMTVAMTAARVKSGSLDEENDLYLHEFSDVKTLQISEFHPKEFECKEQNPSLIEVSIRRAQRKSAESDLTLKEKLNSQEEEEGKNFDEADREYKIMNRVWIQWMKFVHQKKPTLDEGLQTRSLSYAEKGETSLYDGQEYEVLEHETDINDEDCDNYANEYFFKQFQRQKNNSTLRRYFKKWRNNVSQKGELKNLKAEKQEREARIRKYIELIEAKKKSIAKAKTKSSPCLDKDVSDFSDSSSKVSKAESYVSTSSKTYGEKYRHRLEAQKTIIATQKSKLEDQSKLIEDLKSFQMKLEAEMSQRESSKNLKEALQNFDPRHKSKAAFVQKALSSDSFRSFEGSNEDDLEPHFDLDKQKKSMSLEIVRRMEKRNEERKLKFLAAQERRRQLEEEKLLKIKEEEEMKQRRQLEEKQRKFQEMRERQQLEKERAEERLRERELFHENCHIAHESNRRRLLAKGLRALRHNVLVMKRDTFIAGLHYKEKLQRSCLRFWRRRVQSSVAAKINEAEQFYKQRLIRKAFTQLLEIYKDYIQKLQAADDMFDMKVVSKCFRRWYDITCIAYLRSQEMMKIAANFHNRRILRSNFNQWKKLPKIMFTERGREQRLRTLRERVQELLPDYHPIPFDDKD